MTSITSHFSHDPAQPDLTPAVRLIDGTRFTSGALAGMRLGDPMRVASLAQAPAPAHSAFTGRPCAAAGFDTCDNAMPRLSDDANT